MLNLMKYFLYFINNQHNQQFINSIKEYNAKQISYLQKSFQRSFYLSAYVKAA